MVPTVQIRHPKGPKRVLREQRSCCCNFRKRPVFPDFCKDFCQTLSSALIPCCSCPAAASAISACWLLLAHVSLLLCCVPKEGGIDDKPDASSPFLRQHGRKTKIGSALPHLHGHPATHNSPISPPPPLSPPPPPQNLTPSWTMPPRS